MLLLVLGASPISVGSIRPTDVLIGELVGGVVGGAIFGLIGLSASRRAKVEAIHPVEILTWSRSTHRAALTTGLGVGGICTLVFSAAFGIGAGLLYAATTGLALGLLVLSRGLNGSEVQLEEKDVPNQGIVRSGYNALGVGLSIGLTSGGPIGILVGLLAGSSFQYVFGLPFGLAVGLILALFYGGEACLKHLLLRVKLYRDGLVPWNYAQFLDHAVEHIFLRKVGGGYIFVHPLLEDYFASRYTGSPPKLD
jgi:hypothetical protein